MERLARLAGLEVDELRELLRSMIAERQAEQEDAWRAELWAAAGLGVESGLNHSGEEIEMDHLTLTLTDRLPALEDARDWFERALVLVANGNIPGATYAAHAALEHGREAEDTLIDWLASTQADPEAVALPS